VAAVSRFEVPLAKRYLRVIEESAKQSPSSTELADTDRRASA